MAVYSESKMTHRVPKARWQVMTASLIGDWPFGPTPTASRESLRYAVRRPALIRQFRRESVQPRNFELQTARNVPVATSGRWISGPAIRPAAGRWLCWRGEA